MNQFYSSLVIGRRFPGVHPVYRPRYNKEFFKRLNANIKHLESHVEHRVKNPKEILDNIHLKTLKDDAAKLIKLKDRLAKNEKDLGGSGDNNPLIEVIEQLEAIEERVMPIAIAIPNRSSKLVPESDTVIQQIESDFADRENLTKVLNHTKLSYINSCYSKSVVGPNSHYYTGIGAKLQYGLADFFTAELEAKDFIQTSGMCLTKSAVVEAANSKDLKNYMNDPCRILPNKHQYTTLHLVEASREALVSFISMLEPKVADNPLKLMTTGTGYREGSLWFDSDDKRVTQFQTLHALQLTSSIEPHSVKEFHVMRDLVWGLYLKLSLPSRLVHCSLDSLISNEYDAYRIDIWLPSRQQWIPTGRVSHYLDYITVRTGMKRGHIIDSTVYDGQALFAAIIENHQTSTGRFIIPSVIKEHMVNLTDSETASYFRDVVSSPPVSMDPISVSNVGGVLSNYEQRRHLVKKNYAFGHSEKAKRHHREHINRAKRACIITITLVALYIDWPEFYIQFVPDRLKKFYHDKIFRPSRRVWWWITYPQGLELPEDLPYDKLDKSDYDLTEAQRKKKFWKRFEIDSTSEETGK